MSKITLGQRLFYDVGLTCTYYNMGKRWPNIRPTRWSIVGPTWWPYVEPTCWPYRGPMSKITMGQRLFYDVGPTCTYYHGPTLAQHSHAMWESHICTSNWIYRFTSIRRLGGQWVKIKVIGVLQTIFVNAIDGVDSLLVFFLLLLPLLYRTPTQSLSHKT